MNNFLLVLGNENPYLPGKTWTQYNVEVLDDKMICQAKKDPSKKVEISYEELVSAEFGIGSGNLWLQCKMKDGRLNFCSPRKSWKSEAGKKLVDKVESFVPVLDKDDYQKYTGKLFFLHMFK